MNLLIINDLQNDFHPAGMMPVPGSNALVTKANRLMESFDLVVATQLWYPANHLIFAANHPWRMPGQTIKSDSGFLELKEIHCVAESFGAELMAGLETDKIDAIFKKGSKPDVAARSAFFNVNGDFTGLIEYLSGKKIKEVFLMGLKTEEAILNTAIDSFRLGYDTKVILDGCKGIDPDKAILLMKQKGMVLLDSIIF